MKGYANNRELREHSDTFALLFIRVAVMIFACAALALFAVPRAAALELSLEENKGESGTIGYVDIDRVFKEFSGTSNAREEFLAEIKKKEDALNVKKQAIFSLKADIAKLKQEHEFALTLPGLMRQADEISAAAAKLAESSNPQTSTSTAAMQISTQTANDSNPQTSTSTAVVQLSTQTIKAANPQILTSTATVQLSTQTVKTANPQILTSTAAVQLSTQTVKTANPQILTSTTAVQLSTQTVKTANPQISTGAVQNIPVVEDAVISALKHTNVSSAAVNAAFISTSTRTTEEVVPSTGLPLAGIDMPGISRVPLNYFKFSVSTSAAEIETVILTKEAELAKKEEALRLAQHQTERELLEYETHKSEMILGRIYLVLKELAVKEGVSVVIDKRNILFGHSAVDLTDKLIKKLEESPI
jgi:Skp family chaperone for outer membrane proteins